MPKNAPHTLYICYFGLREPLVQTQVLPYLRQIRDDGVKILILTYEPDPKRTWTNEEINIERKKLSEEGIEWHFLTYHKRPSAPATLFDVMCGAWFVWKMIRRKKIDILHTRSHVPAMMGAIAKSFSFGKKPKLLFDIRGFFPEEYVDAGIWKENGLLYKSVKRIEKRLLRNSDGFVVLTEKARDILFPESKENGFDQLKRPVEVIPCCVDLKRFEDAGDELRHRMRRKLKLENRFVIVYVGSFGGFYMTEETADFYGAAKKKRPDSFALILTQSKPEMIQVLLEKYGYEESDFFIQKVSPKEIPAFLSASDIALSFIKPSFSKLASSPTKNAEYLACGLPLIANSKVGDTTEFILEDETGVVIEEFTAENYQKALTELDKLMQNKGDLAEKCRMSARKRFDLINVGGAGYRRLYQKILVKG